MSERSRWVHIDTPAPPVPDKPTGLEATASNGQVVLTWDDPEDESITGYVILRRLPGTSTRRASSMSSWRTRGRRPPPTPTTSVAAETRYTYRIKAINAHGTSERSRWVPHRHPGGPVAGIEDGDGKGAICTRDGRMLSNELVIIVGGPGG